MGIISKDTIEKAYTADSYFKLIEKVVANQNTTGGNQNEALAHYTKLNLQRIHRLLKTTEITAELKEKIQQINKPIIWLVIAEGWCGDAAQSTPVLAKIAELNSKIRLRFILRDENLDIMDQFLTDGARSIPKLIALDTETLEVLYTWGPRPVPAQKMMNEFKKNGSIGGHEVIAEQIQEWYNHDKSQTMQKEFSNLF